mgnify:CR=1 FL=1
MGGLWDLITANPVIFWLIVAVVAGIFEAATVGLVSIWFSIGALVTMLPAAFGIGFNFQIIVFIAASVVAMIFTRPFLKNILHVEKTPTNADLVIGQKGVVVSPVDNILEKGRVLANEWAARSADGTKLDKGAVVLVKELRGVKLIVEKVSDKEEEN